MSDADDQLGGTGGEHGPKPEERDRRPGDKGVPQNPQVGKGGGENTEDSFPASDPPGNY